MVYSSFAKGKLQECWRHKWLEPGTVYYFWGEFRLQWLHAVYVVDVDPDGRPPSLPVDGSIPTDSRVVMTLRLGTLTEAAYKVLLSCVGHREALAPKKAKRKPSNPLETDGKPAIKTAKVVAPPADVVAPPGKRGRPSKAASSKAVKEVTPSSAAKKPKAKLKTDAEKIEPDASGFLRIIGGRMDSN